MTSFDEYDLPDEVEEYINHLEDQNQFLEEELRKSEQTVLELQKQAEGKDVPELLMKVNEVADTLSEFHEVIEEGRERRKEIEGKLGEAEKMLDALDEAEERREEMWGNEDDSDD